MWSWKKKKSGRNLNRRRDEPRGEWLQVKGRGGSRDHTHKVGALVVLLAVLAGLVWAVVAGTEVLGALFFSRNEQFTIRRLDVLSNGRLSPEHLREYGKVAEGMNLFAVNLAQVRANLEKVPLIREAEVRRDLPDTLIIRVTERTALGRLAEGAGGYPMLVDRDGYVLGLGRQSALPLITGAAERGLGPGSLVREKNVLDALALLDLCDTTRLGSVVRIQSIDVRDPERMLLTLADGEKIPMGRDRLNARLEKLTDVLKTAQELGQTVKTADLTVLRNVPVIYRTP